LWGQKSGRQEAKSWYGVGEKARGNDGLTDRQTDRQSERQADR